MDDIAEQIVKKARMMPQKTGVVLKCNGVSIAKVAVTGGVGIEVRVPYESLLFPFAEINAAVECFVTAAQKTPGTERDDRWYPYVYQSHERHSARLLHFEWSNRVERKKALVSIARILKHPPLSDKTANVESSTKPLDARGFVGWDADM